MKHYKGANQNDMPTGGGSFVAIHKFGHEIFNFLPYKGYCYGYVQPPGSVIDITRIGAGKEDKCIDNVYAVWVSRSPFLKRTVIIGWYKNAKVFKKHQKAPRGSNRRYKNTEIGYFIMAKEDDCTLLPIDERIFPIPRRKKGGMGQSNVWYADNPENFKFKQEVLAFVEKGIRPSRVISKNQSPGGRAWQPDPLKRQKVERIAIEQVISYYTRNNYSVDSVEKDNLGWDLEARIENTTLKLEVKGLSGHDISVDFTPREYEKMKENKDSYRICIVTDCLSTPTLKIFSFSPESGQWEDSDGNSLNLKEIIGARMSL